MTSEERLALMKERNTERKVTRVAPGEAIGARPFRAPYDAYVPPGGRLIGKNKVGRVARNGPHLGDPRTSLASGRQPYRKSK